MRAVDHGAHPLVLVEQVHLLGIRERYGFSMVKLATQLRGSGKT